LEPAETDEEKLTFPPWQTELFVAFEVIDAVGAVAVFIINPIIANR
jgi:hypothetical protein